MSDDSDLTRMIYRSALEPEQFIDMFAALSEELERQLSQSLSQQNQLTVSSGSSPHSQLPNSTPNRSVVAPSSSLGDQDGIAALVEDFKFSMSLSKQISQAAAEKENLSTLLDNMPLAAILVSADGRVINCNQQGRRVLQGASFLTLVADYIHARDPDSHKLLYEAITALGSPRAVAPAPQLIELKTSHAPTTLATAIAYQQSMFDFDEQVNKANICILLYDQATSLANNINRFAQRYQLTPAEVKLLNLLIEGKDLKSIAAERFVSHHTIRTQLKKLLKKTACGKQAELVKNAVTYGADLPRLSVARLAVDTAGANQRRDQVLVLPDGRKMGYAEFGAIDGEPIVHCHGMASCRLDCPDEYALMTHSVRLIIPDRPGYGLSDPNPGHGIVDWAGDLLFLMNHLKIDQFSLLAADFSSAFAFGVATVAAARVKTIILLDGAAPMADDFHGRRSVPRFYKTAVFFARHFPKVIHHLAHLAVANFHKHEVRATEKLIKMLGTTNYRVLSKPTVKQQVIAVCREVFKQGSGALSTNQILIFSDWGFDVSAIKVSVLLFTGRSDGMVKFHAQSLAENLANIRVIETPGQGWASLYFENFEAVIEQSIEHIAATSTIQPQIHSNPKDYRVYNKG